MKFVKSLVTEEIYTLEELHRNRSDYRSRVRAHAILLSSRGYSIKEISKFYQVDRDTVSIWIENWGTYGIVGLFDEKKSGRPPILNENEQKQAIEFIKDDPKSLKQAVAQIEENVDKSVSTKTLKRILKKAKYIWKRVRTSLKGKRDPEKFKLAKNEIATLIGQQFNYEINLYYYDESGFSLTPKIPYAWQEINKNIELPSARSHNLNVLGLFQANGNFESMVVEGTVNTAVIVSYFNKFVETITLPTWIIMDNAPTHKSAEFMANIERWKNQGLHLYFLPPYSPELNLIEILWRFIKYQWLPFSAYLNFGKLKDALNDILANVGTKYQITFV
jgi:transposase